MILLVKLIGIFMACVGVINIINPAPMKKMLAFWGQGRRIYAGGLLRLLVGAIFLWSHGQARIPAVIGGLGILILLAGLFIFILGLERVKAMLGWWGSKPNSLLRLIATFILAIGASVIYSA